MKKDKKTETKLTFKHGAVVGVTNVIGYVMKLDGFSRKVVTVVRQFAYYGSMLTIEFLNAYSQQPVNDSEPSKITNAVTKAATQTATLLGVNFVLQKVGGWLKRAGHVLARKGRGGVGRVVSLLGGLLPYVRYPVTAMQTSTAETLTQFAVGSVTQSAVEFSGGYIVSKMFFQGRVARAPLVRAPLVRAPLAQALSPEDSDEELSNEITQ